MNVINLPLFSDHADIRNAKMIKRSVFSSILSNVSQSRKMICKDAASSGPPSP